ncbi:MAG: hypothetical protein M4579_003496 [Chaenotheca gracillima]|nr:MAG: hypothetical protein M4579_003496 [Chaenotheca gracillima]
MDDLDEIKDTAGARRFRISTALVMLVIFSLFAILIEVVRTDGGLLKMAEKRQIATIPPYVLSYAPLVWTMSKDPYYPSDIGAQLLHTKPEVNFTAVAGAPSSLTLDNVDVLNGLGGADVYLTSVDDITKNPSWLYGVAPDASGKTEGAVSAVIIVNDHGAGNVDSFYMYFNAYNQGNVILGQELGDHVGDWEHNMIRFKNGKPQTVWYSQHNNGEAFTYAAVEKQGQRPVAYSAQGSHAVYATTGTHDHTIPDLNLPVGFAEDHCDKGKLWDPTLSAYMYSFDASSSSFTPAAGSNPVGFLNYNGKWGDQQYPDSDSRQKKFFGNGKYTGGPTGPKDKQLNRTNVCPDNNLPCIIRPVRGP